MHNIMSFHTIGSDVIIYFYSSLKSADKMVRNRLESVWAGLQMPSTAAIMGTFDTYLNDVPACLLTIKRFPEMVFFSSTYSAYFTYTDYAEARGESLLDGL